MKVSMEHADVRVRSLVEQNYGWLMAYFIAATGQPDQAEDLAQEVLTLAIENEARFKPSGSFGAWLRGIARNVRLQYYKQHRKGLLFLDNATIEQLDFAAGESEAGHTAPAFLQNRLEALKACIVSLADRSRTALELRYGQERSSREIGERLGMTSLAVNMLLCRGRKLLEVCIDRKLRGMSRV